MFQSDQAMQFANRLHALKVRTDRSYEALAKRVGVSSSTLHRYCRGEAVPSSYDVIARFSRVCGASQEEANELLRYWTLTVNVSQRQGGHTPIPAPVWDWHRWLRRFAAMLAIAGVLGGVAIRRYRMAPE